MFTVKSSECDSFKKANNKRRFEGTYCLLLQGLGYWGKILVCLYCTVINCD
jgi:hypothetical protein